MDVGINLCDHVRNPTPARHTQWSVLTCRVYHLGAFDTRVLNASLAAPPTIDDMFVAILPAGNLRNSPGASAPQNKTFESIRFECRGQTFALREHS